jgi:hypothetical protein
MNTAEFYTKFNNLPTLSQRTMAQIITKLYAEPGFSDVSAEDLDLTPEQWSGVSKRLIADGLIFTEPVEGTGRPQWDAIYAPVHTYEAEDDGSWAELQHRMTSLLEGTDLMKAMELLATHSAEPIGHDDCAWLGLRGQGYMLLIDDQMFVADVEPNMARIQQLDPDTGELINAWEVK